MLPFMLALASARVSIICFGLSFAADITHGPGIVGRLDVAITTHTASAAVLLALVSGVSKIVIIIITAIVVTVIITTITPVEAVPVAANPQQIRRLLPKLWWDFDKPTRPEQSPALLLPSCRQGDLVTPLAAGTSANAAAGIVDIGIMIICVMLPMIGLIFIMSPTVIAITIATTSVVVLPLPLPLPLQHPLTQPQQEGAVGARREGIEVVDVLELRMHAFIEHVVVQPGLMGGEVAAVRAQL